MIRTSICNIILNRCPVPSASCHQIVESYVSNIKIASEYKLVLVYKYLVKCSESPGTDHKNIPSTARYSTPNLIPDNIAICDNDFTIAEEDHY